ncbi:MAG: TonB-dependent receptor [Bacteroidales bacterium]|nr:TonB-dependent receptor [Bacteroidales bacterium]
MKKTLFIILCLWASQAILSGQPDTLIINQYDLEGVVISADKRASGIMDVPASVSSLSGISVKNDRIGSTTDLTGPIPNLYMPDYGSRLTSPIYIRGIGSRINSPSVGFYMDEVALFEKAAFDLDLYNIERIEVLRGPQGTLYGRNTLGGIVHVITREPDNRPGLGISAELGTYGNQQYQVMLENPVVRDRLYVQVNGYYRTRNGFHINQFNGEAVDGMNSGGGSIKLLFHPSPRSKITLSTSLDLSSEGAYPYAVVTEDGDELPINYDHESSYQREMTGTSLRYERTGDVITINSISSFQSLKGLQDIDQDFTPDDLFTVTQDQDQKLFTQEIRIGNTDNRSRLNWVTGIYGFYQANDQEVGVEFGLDGITRFRLPYESYSYKKLNDMTNYGLAMFGQGTLSDLLVRDLSLTLGMRVDYENDALDYYYERYPDGATVPTEDFESGFDFFEILPKLSLNYKWSENQMNYLSVTRGYKSGGFNTTFEREEDRSFLPEYSWNYEMGWKASLESKKANLRMALFYIDWEDLQVYQPVPSGRGSMLKNAASAFSQGIELEVSLLPVSNLRITGNLGYSDTRFVDFTPDPDETLNYSGNKVPYVPDLTGFLSASFRVPLKGDIFHDLVFSANWREIGKIFWNDANEYFQEAYGLLAANMAIGISDFTLRLWTANLLNTSYRSFQFESLGLVYAQPGRPRSFGLTLSYSL